MELTPVTYLIVLPLVFLAGFVDSVAGGGGIISLPAYLMAGIPAHLAAGTNKVVNGTGTLVAALKYFRNGKVLLRPAVTAAVCALIGSAVGTELAALISEQTLETLMLVALPCVAVFLSVKKDFGRDIPAEDRPVYTPRQELLRSALIGLVFGCYDGLVGPGTGTFMILGFTALLSLDLITRGRLRQGEQSGLLRRLRRGVDPARAGALGAGDPRSRVQHRRQLSRRALCHPRRQQEDPQRDVSGAGAAVREDAL